MFQSETARTIETPGKEAQACLARPVSSFLEFRLFGEGFEVYTAIPLGRREPSQTAHDGHAQGWVAAGWLGDTALSRLVGLSKSESATQLLLFHLPCGVICFITHYFVPH